MSIEMIRFDWVILLFVLAMVALLVYVVCDIVNTKMVLKKIRAKGNKKKRAIDPVLTWDDFWATNGEHEKLRIEHNESMQRLLELEEQMKKEAEQAGDKS